MCKVLCAADSFQSSEHGREIERKPVEIVQGRAKKRIRKPREDSGGNADIEGARKCRRLKKRRKDCVEEDLRSWNICPESAGKQAEQKVFTQTSGPK